VKRRQFLAAAASSLAVTQAAVNVPVIDTHIHLFDPRRPQGVPWPPKDNQKLYQPALPDRYRRLTAEFGVVGAVKVEASPWLEDNQWVLDLIANEPLIVGMVGNIEPGKPDFARHLDRFRANRLFLGIRCGLLWDRNLNRDIENPAVVADLKRLADAGLSMDTANQTPELIHTTLKLTDRIPNLRIIVDHLPQLNPPTEPAALKAYMGDLAELAKRPQVYFKVSAVIRRVEGRVITDPAFYRDRLDMFWDMFGPDRLMFGSDWPNSDNWAGYREVFTVVREYFSAKGQEAMEKVFWRTSIPAYRWVHRDARQPKL
jgi:predicted TIM-barrel fold metal-dependent hydrolase